MLRRREVFACSAVIVLACGCSQRQNIEPAFRPALRAVSGTVYSATMPGGTIKLPADAPWEVVEFAPTATGRALSTSEVQTLVSYMERLDRLEPSDLVAGCSNMSSVFVRLNIGSVDVDISIDPDCGHLVFTDASKRKRQMLWMGKLGSEFIGWARKIDPIAMTAKQP